MNDRVELFAFFFFFFFRGNRSVDVLRFGTDLQLRNHTEWKRAERWGREEERHGIKYARDHCSVGANLALAADNKKTKRK